ncbi:DUF3828 domain-containing protein [Vitreimonas flagellata]|uniref:DUF3828 domain-containing protein n=1 Tax=Vitreimonas flagellata TaxID=2560861 RepID=UPI0010749FFC|nr:DUF3828 domain-containing protein [Vitreimonas flagellata]
MRRRNLVLGFAAVAALAACEREPAKVETPPATDTGVARAVTDPASVVVRFYDPYLAPDGQIPPLMEAAPWSTQMNADLQAMFQRSQAQGEPILDFDPIIDAQDYQLSDVRTATEGIVEGSHASVRASFTNAGQHEEVLYDLVWQDDRWKVDNVRTAEWDLRTIIRG